MSLNPTFSSKVFQFSQSQSSNLTPVTSLWETKMAITDRNRSVCGVTETLAASLRTLRRKISHVQIHRHSMRQKHSYANPQRQPHSVTESHPLFHVPVNCRVFQGVNKNKQLYFLSLLTLMDNTSRSCFVFANKIKTKKIGGRKKWCSSNCCHGDYSFLFGVTTCRTREREK